VNSVETAVSKHYFLHDEESPRIPNLRQGARQGTLHLADIGFLHSSANDQSVES